MPFISTATMSWFFCRMFENVSVNSPSAINFLHLPLIPFTCIRGSSETLVTSRAASGEIMLVKAPVSIRKSFVHGII